MMKQTKMMWVPKAKQVEVAPVKRDFDYELSKSVLHFETVEEVNLFVSRFSYGSIFWTKSGKEQTVVSCLRRATRLGLDYDVAANDYVCPTCLSAAPNATYFTNYHSNCRELFEAREAIVCEKGEFNYVSTFEVFPRYCSREQESHIVEWMESTLEKFDEPPATVIIDQQFFNHKLGAVEMRCKEVEAIEYQADVRPSSKFERTKRADSTRALKAQYQANQIKMRSMELRNLVREVVEICEHKSIPLIFTDAKKKRCFPRIPLKHTHDKIVDYNEIQTEGDIIPETRRFLEQYDKLAVATQDVRDYEITRGWSGIILHKDDLAHEPELQTRCVGNLFVVLGRCEHGDLQNALDVKCNLGLEFYSGETPSGILNHGTFKFHPADHKYKSRNLTDAEWDDMRCWYMMLLPYYPQCEGCKQPDTLEDFVTNVRGSVALKQLARSETTLGRTFHRWAITILNELTNSVKRDKANTRQGRSSESFFLREAPLGPLFNVADSMNRAVIDIQGAVQVMQQTINNAAMNENQRNQAILNEVSKIKQHSFLQVDDMLKQFQQVAQTYQNMIATAGAPLSIHSMRQLLMDSRMDDSLEFDITRKRGATSVISPMAFRVFEDVYTQPGVYNTKWINLVPNGSLQTDLDYLRLDLPISVIQGKDHLTSNAEIRPDTCFVDVGQTSVNFCEKVDRCFVPVPHILRVGSPQNPTMIKIQDQDGAKTFVPKPGFCYVMQFVVMLGWVPDLLVTSFINEIKQLTEQLGPWPLFKDFLEGVKNLIIRFPTTIKAPTVLYVVDHTGGTIHAMTTLGCVNKHEHYLSLNCVTQLHDAAMTMQIKHFADYRIGGVIPDLKRLIQSEENLVEILTEKPQWLVHVLISPTQIWALSKSVVKYQVAQKTLSSNPDLAVALAQLVVISKNFSVFNETRKVVDSYFETATQLERIAPVILGDNYEYFQVMLSQYAATRYSTDVVHLMDQFDTRKKTLEDSEEFYRQIIPDILIEFGLLQRSDFGFVKRTCRGIVERAPTTRPTLRSLGSLSMKGLRMCGSATWCGMIFTKNIPCHYLPRFAKWLFVSSKVKTFDITWSLASKYIKGNVRAILLDSAMYGLMTMGLLIIVRFLHKLLKFINRIISSEQGDKEVTVFHAKGQGDTLFIKCMAWIALIAGCFNVGLGNDIYFATTKFRSLLDMATTQSPDNFIFHAQSSSSEEEIDELVTKDNFIDYVYNHSDPLMDFDSEDLSGWYDRISYQGRILEHPLRHGDKTFLNKYNIDEIAREVVTNSGKELTVIGGVGSGKSTSLPVAVSGFGPVLILVPSRELVNNLCESIWFVGKKQVSTYMMNSVVRGTSNISVMTYGYALMYFSNNPQEIDKYRFIQMDECHEFSAHMIVFYSWWRENARHTKLYKTTATPPGTVIKNRTVDTNHEVIVSEVKQVSVEEFCRRSVDQHAEGLRTLLPEGGRVIIFVSSRSECELAKNMLTGIPGARTWAVYRSATIPAKKLATELEEDTGHKYQIIITTTVLQNGVNLDPDCVVDFGQTYEAVYDRDGRCMNVRRRNINPSELTQRVGRVGRNKPGKMIQVGKRLEQETAPNACVVTDAIMMCFSKELAPFISSHMIDEVNFVTREQVATAMKFSAPLLFMIHYVRRDGHMLEGYYDQFKGLMLQTGSVPLCPDLAGCVESKSYITLRSYQMRGIIEHVDRLPELPIPFYSAEFSINFYIRIGEITKEAMKRQSFVLRIPTPDVHKAVLRLSTSKTHIDMTIGILHKRLALTRDRLEQFNTLKAAASGMKLTPLFNQCFDLGASRNERALRASLTAGNELLASLELARTEKSDQALAKLIADNPLLNDCLVFHGSPEEYLEDRIFPSNKGLLNKYVIAVVGLVVVVGCATWFYMRRREKYVLHGKVRAREIGLSTNNILEPSKQEALYEWTGDDEAMGERFGQAYTRKFRNGLLTKQDLKEKEIWDKRETQQTSVYKTLYDLDPTKFKYVVAVCPDFDLKKRLNRQEKKQLATTIVEACHARAQQLGKHDYKGVERATVYLFNDDGTGKKVELTPHNPAVISRTTSHPVGFPAETGKLRQTGQALEMTQEELADAMKEEYIQHSRCQVGITHLEKHLAIVSSDGQQTQCFITQSKCIAPYHLSLAFKADSKLTIHCSNGSYTMPVPKVEKIKDMDLVIFEMPSEFPPIKKCSAMREPTNQDEVVLITGIRTPNGITSRFSNIVTISKQESGTWKYMVESVPGVCGGMVMDTNDGKVVGFHSAAVVRRGLGCGAIFTPVTTQMLECLEKGSQYGFEWKFNSDLLSWKGVPANMDPRSFPVSKTLSDFIFHGNEKEHATDKYYGENLTIQGRILQTYNNRHVVKGLDSRFAEFVNINGEPPAKLFCHLPSDLSQQAFYKDFLKYSSPVEIGSVNIGNFNLAINRVIEHLCEQGFVKKEFQVETDFYKILNSFNLDTAMGALYQSKKKDILPLATHEQLQEWFLSSLENLHEGKLGLWKASLKAELRPEEKVLAGKTRVFTAAPFDVSFGAKAFVDAFNNKFYSHQQGSHWTVGINKFNCGWDELARRFNPSWKFIDADGSRYDSSLTPLLFNAVIQIREFFLDGDREDFITLRNLYTQLVWTPITTITGQVVKKNKGGPSGQPSTVVDNTLMLMIAVEYANICEQVNEIQYTCNGDDLLLNAPTHVCQVIRSKYSKHFSDLGLTYDFEQEVDTISDVEYMSHRWLDADGVMIPKLKPERILSVLQWNKSLDIDSQANKINAAWIESFGYADLMKYIKEYADWWSKQTGKIGFLCSQEKVAALYLTNDVKITVETHDDLVFHSGVTADGVADPPDGGNKAQNENKDKDKGTDKGDGSGNQNLANTVVARNYIYMPPKAKGIATNDIAKKMADYIPPDALISTQSCTLAQFNKWLDAAANGLGKSVDDFIKDVLPYWIYWCIVNGASDEHKKRASWEKVNMTVTDEGVVNLDANNPQESFEMTPMFQEARPTLRAVMRHMGPLAYRWVKFSLSKHKPIIPHNAAKAGVRDPTYYPCSIDFVTIDQLSPQEMDMRNQVINARTTEEGRPAFVHAQRPGAGEEDTNLRRDDDANYGRTRIGGARFGPR